jgi:putative cofactor-binding repeat protein
VKRRLLARLRRKLLLEALEERRVMATFYVNDNWNFVSDADASGTLSIGDVINNANDSGSTTYTIGTDSVFGAVTTGTVTGTLPAGGTIQSAINAAATGDTIELLAGAYVDVGTVTVADKVITIQGPQKNQSPVANLAAWTTSANLATVSRFAIVGTGGLTVKGLRLVGGSGGGDDDSAIITTGIGDLSIVNSLISVTAGANKRGTGIDVSSQNVNVTVTDSLFTGFTNPIAPDNGWGIYLNYANSTSRSVSITGNKFDMAGDLGSLDGTVTGIPIGFDGYSASKGVLAIEGNTFTNTTPWYAIGALDWAGIVTNDVVYSGIKNNTFTNAVADISWSDTGVFRNRTAWLATIGSNTIGNSTFAQLVVGPNAAASTINGGADDDYISGQGQDDWLAGLDGNDSLVGNGGNDTLTGGAGTNAIDGGTGTDTAVFSGNYADYTLAFSGANVVVTRTNGGSSVDTVTSVERLQFADKSVYVVGSAVASEYTTIAQGITAASAGDVVLVAQGTYSEAIVVDKPLTLLGAQAGVKATGATRTGGETVIDGTGNSSSYNVTVEANDVTIDGFKVEIRNSARDGINTRTGNPVAPATVASRSNITLVNNWIYANLPSRTNQFNGIVFGEHISNGAQSFSAVISNVTIDNNYIDLTSTSSTATPANQSIVGARGIVFTNMFRNGGASLDYTGLKVRDNTVYSTYNTIIQAQLQTRMVGATFSGNTIGNGRSGPNLPTLVSGSVFSNNTIQNINPGSDYYSNLAGAYFGGRGFHCLRQYVPEHWGYGRFGSGRRTRGRFDVLPGVEQLDRLEQLFHL